MRWIKRPFQAFHLHSIMGEWRFFTMATQPCGQKDALAKNGTGKRWICHPAGEKVVAQVRQREKWEMSPISHSSVHDSLPDIVLFHVTLLTTQREKKSLSSWRILLICTSACIVETCLLTEHSMTIPSRLKWDTQVSQRFYRVIPIKRGRILHTYCTRVKSGREHGNGEDHLLISISPSGLFRK